MLSSGRHGPMSRVPAALNTHHTLRSALQEPARGICNNHGANDNQGSIRGIRLSNTNEHLSLRKRKSCPKKRDTTRKCTALSPKNPSRSFKIRTTCFNLHEAHQRPCYIFHDLAVASSRESAEGEVLEKTLGYGK